MRFSAMRSLPLTPRARAMSRFVPWGSFASASSTRDLSRGFGFSLLIFFFNAYASSEARLLAGAFAGFFVVFFADFFAVLVADEAFLSAPAGVAFFVEAF